MTLDERNANRSSLEVDDIGLALTGSATTFHTFPPIWSRRQALAATTAEAGAPSKLLKNVVEFSLRAGFSGDDPHSSTSVPISSGKTPHFEFEKFPSTGTDEDGNTITLCDEDSSLKLLTFLDVDESIYDQNDVVIEGALQIRCCRPTKVTSVRVAVRAEDRLLVFSTAADGETLLQDVKTEVLWSCEEEVGSSIEVGEQASSFPFRIPLKNNRLLLPFRKTFPVSSSKLNGVIVYERRSCVVGVAREPDGSFHWSLEDDFKAIVKGTGTDFIRGDYSLNPRIELVFVPWSSPTMIRTSLAVPANVPEEVETRVSVDRLGFVQCKHRPGYLSKEKGGQIEVSILLSRQKTKADSLFVATAHLQERSFLRAKRLRMPFLKRLKVISHSENIMQLMKETRVELQGSVDPFSVEARITFDVFGSELGWLVAAKPSSLGKLTNQIDHAIVLDVAVGDVEFKIPLEVHIY